MSVEDFDRMREKCDIFREAVDKLETEEEKYDFWRLIKIFRSFFIESIGCDGMIDEIKQKSGKNG